MGQLVLRRTNHDTRHSAWNSWLHTFSLRISSGSVPHRDFTDTALVASSETSGPVVSFAGSGGEGAWRVERQIALLC
jgi:hypothetical protein